MARTPSELLSELFRAGAATEYDKLKEAADRRDQTLASHGLSDSTTRARVTTQLFVDSYEGILNYVLDQLNIPAESIGIRTQDDADALLRMFEHDADATRTRFRMKRDNRLATVRSTWKPEDEYDRMTANSKARAAASLKLHLAATLSPEAKAREAEWKRLAIVVDNRIKAESHDIDEEAKNATKELGRRLPPPPQAYDENHIAGMLLRALKKRMVLIFSAFPDAVAQLGVNPEGLESLIRSHINSLVDEAVTASRALVAREFEEWGKEVPRELVEKTVGSVRAAALSQAELMLVEMERVWKRAPKASVQHMSATVGLKGVDAELFGKIQTAVDGLWNRYCQKIDGAKQSRLDHLADIRGLNQGDHSERHLGIISDSAVDKAHEIFVAYQDILKKFAQQELHEGFEPLVREHASGMLKMVEGDFRESVEKHFRSRGWRVPKERLDDRVRIVHATAAGELELFLHDLKPKIAERLSENPRLAAKEAILNEESGHGMWVPSPERVGPQAQEQQDALVAMHRDGAKATARTEVNLSTQDRPVTGSRVSATATAPEPATEKESKGMSKGMEIFLGSVVAALFVWGIQQYVSNRTKESDRRFEARKTLLAELTEPSKRCDRALFNYWMASQNLDDTAKPKLEPATIVAMDSAITKECEPLQAGDVIMDGRLKAAYDSTVARRFWMFGQAIIDLHARTRGYFANNPPRSPAVRAALDSSSMREQTAVFELQKALSSYSGK